MVISAQYSNRETKQKYVWKKYKQILKGRILDVGADNCILKKFLPQKTECVEIGLGGLLDVKINLEKEQLPYEEDSFDCILCLDVLEHLDNFHTVFDNLCLITNKYLIISLPTPWESFMDMLRCGYYKNTTRPMKYYNLPLNCPHDRHKWFYGSMEFMRQKNS